MIPAEILIWIPVVTLLACIPMVCYKDAKYRMVEHSFWNWIVGINIPVLGALVYLGIYEWWMFIITGVAIVIYFAAMKFHYIEGADFMFILWIVTFLIYNPFTGHWFMALPFTIYLVAMMIVTTMMIVTWNFVHGNGLSVEFERGVPMMFPISSALILTVVLA